ncbi:MAG: TIGR04211 family SH3 domain-containing protein [Candidatus Sedimenticola sp. (ex Thyasira tokunagai)]
MKKIVLAILLASSFSGAYAETRYVTDVNKITLRSGESTTHKVIRMLTSGQAVEVIASSKASGYSNIRTKEGQTGYVLTRLLMSIPSARERLTAAEARLEELEKAPGELSSQLAQLQGEHEVLTTQFGELETVKQSLEQELQSIRRTAANAIRISSERNELRQQVADFTHQVEGLKQENRELTNNQAQHWFLIGAGVIVGGILIGLILPRLRVQRRKDTW